MVLREDGGAFKEKVKCKWEKLTPDKSENSTCESPSYLIIPIHLDFAL